MAYDNHEHWVDYRGSFLRDFLWEFRSDISVSENDMDFISEELLGMDYKAACSFLANVSLTDRPVDTLRKRFKAFAYKRRRKLATIDVSLRTKMQLNQLIKKADFSDYDDVIQALISKCISPDEEFRNELEGILREDANKFLM